MATLETAQIVCPACEGGPIIPMDGGTLFCAACRNEWNPAEVSWLPPASEPEPADPAAAILGPPPEVVAMLDADIFLTSLIGTGVTLDGGQRGVIVEFPDDDDDAVVVELADGRIERVPLGDVLSHDTVPPADQSAAVDDTATQALAATTATIAAMVLDAAAAAVVSGEHGLELRLPPGGWLPDDGEVMPLIEQGAAYAVALLILNFGIPPETVRGIGAQLIEQTTSDESEK